MLSIKRHPPSISQDSPLLLHCSSLLLFTLLQPSPENACGSFLAFEPMLIKEAIKRALLKLKWLEYRVAVLSAQKEETAAKLVWANQKQKMNKDSLKNAERRIQELEEEIEEKEVSRLLEDQKKKETILSLKQEVQKLQQTLQTTSAQSKYQETLNISLQQSIKSAKQNAKAAKREKNKEKQYSSELKEDLTNVLAVNSELTTELQKSKSANRSLQSSRDKANNELKKVQVQLVTNSKQQAQVKRDLEELKRTRVVPDGNKCAICYENPLEIMYCPCMHICTCAECAVRLEKCPVCCGLPTSKKRVYL